MMRISGILPNSLTNGEGCRFVVFFQGCPHHCEECHNSHTWNPDGGVETSIADMVNLIQASLPIIDGITLSGGEPFEQAHYASIVAMLAKELNLSVWTYTGYEHEALKDMANYDVDIKRLLENTDVLVDGRFDKDLTSPNLKWVGSSNQRILYLKEE